MKIAVLVLATAFSLSAFAGKMVSAEGYVKIADTGTYKGQYVFAQTLERVRAGIESTGPLPNDVELLEICDWSPEFKTPDPEFVILELNKASIDEARIKVSYYDNGRPLAGMCVETIKLLP